MTKIKHTKTLKNKTPTPKTLKNKTPTPKTLKSKKIIYDTSVSGLTSDDIRVILNEIIQET